MSGISRTRKSTLENLKNKSIYKIEKAKEEASRIEEKRRDGYLPKVIGYCRVSTQGQGEDGDSLSNQETQIKEYCKKQALDCVNVLREVVSGSVHFRERPLLKHIVRELEEKRIDGFVIYKLDRLSRSIRDTIEILSLCSDNGWLFYEIKNNLNTDGPMGKFQAHLFSALAELERNQIIQRTNEVIAYKRSKNHLLGQVPYGKNVVMKEGVKVLIDNPDEIRCVERIMELTGSTYKDHNGKMKNYSLAEICRILEREGYKNKVGNNVFYPNTIKRIIMQASWKPPQNKGTQTEKLEEAQDTVRNKEDEDSQAEDKSEPSPQKPPVLLRQKGFYKLSEEDLEDLQKEEN
jgi:DNA invertase Pin-like site-specific DNA recombinase